MTTLLRRLAGYGPAFVLAITLLACWELYVRAGMVNPQFLPSPIAIGRALFSDWDAIYANTVPTFLEAVLGITAATLLGLLLAIPQGRLLEVGLSALGAGGFFFLVALLSRGGMGGGDVKLAAMMGAFLGWPAIAVALMLAFFLGAGAGLLLIVFRRGTRKTPIPFGPALAAGAIVAVLAGEPILQWYLSLGR